MALHAQGERLEAAQGQEAVERPGHSTYGVLEEGEALGELAVLADGDDTPHHVRMAVQVFGRRMEDDVEAELERALRPGCREGVVADGHDAALARRLGHALEIDQLEQRVGRRLHPDHARLGSEGGLERSTLAQVRVADREAGRALPHALEEPVGAAIEIVHRGYVGAVIEELEHRRGGGEARGEGEALPSALEVGEAALVSHARRVLAARILVALVHARALLHVGRGRVDRRHDGAGRGIGALARVDRAGREAETVGLRGFRGIRHDNTPAAATSCGGANN